MIIMLTLLFAAPHMFLGMMIMIMMVVMTNKMTMMIDDYSAPHVPRYANMVMLIGADDDMMMMMMMITKMTKKTMLSMMITAPHMFLGMQVPPTGPLLPPPTKAAS